MNTKYFNLVLTGLFFLILIATVQACTINVDSFNLGARVEGDYFETISAENNDQIDARISFRITSVSGDDCPSNISSRLRIYRWNNNDWSLFRTSSTKSATLTQDDYVFTWYNEFTIGNYERYKIEGEILEGNNVIDTIESFIDVEDNSCSGIRLVAEDFSVDEGRETTRSFRIENNTSKDFDVSDVRIYFTSSLITSGSADYSNLVRRYDNEIVRVNLSAGNVSYDRTTSGTFAVSGYLGNNYCSETQIGREAFDVTIRETGQYTPSESSSECADLRLVTRNIEMNENESRNEIFYLQNNSNKRFEITNVEVITSRLNIKPYYYEKYIFPGNIGDIILELNSGNAFSNQTYEQILRLGGRFSDGRTCNISNIDESRFFVNINKSTTSSTFTNCGNLAINVPSQLNVENFGEFEVNITNNTGRTATVYLESELDLTLGMIVLPNNTTISKTIGVEIRKETGTITLRPAVESCNIATKTIRINNTAQGNLRNVIMTYEIIENENQKLIRISFNNPTSKSFVGVLRTNLEGQIVGDKTITLPKGESFTEIIVEKNRPIIGEISFFSNGEEQKIEINETQANLAGLFIFGINPTTIGFLFLIIIIIIVVIILVTEPKRRSKEIWETKNY
jgi:hypothetical protein